MRYHTPKRFLRASLSTGVRVASTLTLLLGMAHHSSVYAQATQTATTALETVPEDVLLSAASATDWQSQPITLPIQATQVGLSGDGQHAIALTQNGCIEVWHSQTGDRLLSLPAAENTRFEAISISDDGSKIAAIVQNRNNDLSLWIWDITSGQPLSRVSLSSLPLPYGPFLDNPDTLDTGNFARVSSAVLFSPDAAQVVTRARWLDAHTPEEVLKLHSAETGEVLNMLAPAAGAQIEQLAFSPDGERLVGAGRTILDDATQSSTPVVSVWQTEDGQLLSSLSPSEAIANPDGVVDPLSSVTAIAVTPTGQLKVLVNQNLTSDQLVTWDITTPSSSAQVQTLPEVDRQDFIHVLSPDGTYHFMRGDVAGTRLLNTQTLEVIRIDERVGVAAFSADGGVLAIATPDTVQIFSKTEAQL